MAPLPSSFPLRTATLLVVGGLALPGLADNKSEPAASVAENTIVKRLARLRVPAL